MNKMCIVLYLTSLCDLDCDYCYEKNNRDQPGFKHKTVTKEEIDSFLTEILYREGGYEVNKQVSIFGGEVFLKYDLLEYTLKRMCEVIPNTGIDLITNGVFLSDIKNLKKLKELFLYCRPRGIFPQLEISYDGIGHNRRVFKNGLSSKEIVQQTLENIRTLNMKVFISYTVHKDNCVERELLKDVIRIFEKYGDIIEDFTLQFFKQEVVDTLNYSEKDYINYENRIKERAVYLFYKYNIPICEMVCEYCKKCDKVETKNNYFIPEYGNEYRDIHHIGEFNHFKINQKEQ